METNDEVAAERYRGLEVRRPPWAIALATATALLVGCTPDDGHDFVLITHCGIDDLQLEGQWYERVGGLLDDGSRNPPDGWDNPEQKGTVTRVDETTVVFTDDAGHSEEFVLREGATGPKDSCD